MRQYITKGYPIVLLVLSGLSLGCGNADDLYAGPIPSSGIMPERDAAERDGGGGVIRPPDGGSSGVEVCQNGLDDDGDGEVDEGCPCTGGEQACYPGDPADLEKGICAQGVQRCVEDGEFGRWGPCEDAVLPRSESCNGQDDDCDGEIDEVCGCTPGESKSCGVETGSCSAGTQTCQDDGTWGACLGGTEPQEEVCNGEDDDCDGVVDNVGKCACAVGPTATFSAYDAFLAAYPASAIPESHSELAAFMPEVPPYEMTWAQWNPADEFVDWRRGGILAVNLQAGRDYAREQALLEVPSEAQIVESKESPLESKVLSGPYQGCATCNGVGWGWGTVLYQMPDFSVYEMVYLYIGHCATDGDAEHFYHSKSAVTVCEAD